MEGIGRLLTCAPVALAPLPGGAAVLRGEQRVFLVQHLLQGSAPGVPGAPAGRGAGLAAERVGALGGQLGGLLHCKEGECHQGLELFQPYIIRRYYYI